MTHKKIQVIEVSDNEIEPFTVQISLLFVFIFATFIVSGLVFNLFVDGAANMKIIAALLSALSAICLPFPLQVILAHYRMQK